MRTINIAPDNAGLIRWLQHVYKENPAHACSVLVAGWPMISPSNAVAVLVGTMTLGDAIAAGWPDAPKGWKTEVCNPHAYEYSPSYRGYVCGKCGATHEGPRS